MTYLVDMHVPIFVVDCRGCLRIQLGEEGWVSQVELRDSEVFTHIIADFVFRISENNKKKVDIWWSWIFLLNTSKQHLGAIQIIRVTYWDFSDPHPPCDILHNCFLKTYKALNYEMKKKESVF